MSEEAKLFGKLDEVSAKIDDFQKSTKAEVMAAKEGTAKLEGELASMRKQLQDFAVLAKSGVEPTMREMYRELGSCIVKSYHGKAASEGTNADGGYLVNDELATVIKSAQNQYGLVRQLWGSSIYPMKSDVTKVPVDTYEETSGNVPVPASTSENAQISESNVAQLDQLTLTAQKYATLSYVSNELIDDSFVDYLGAYLTPKLARQASKIEDGVVFTAATTGLLNSSSVQSATLDGTSFLDVTFEDLLDAQDAVVSDALANGQYIAHRSMINVLRKLKGTDGQYLWTPAAGNEPAMILGFPYMKGEILPSRAVSTAAKGFMLFGDVTMGAMVGERMQRSIVTSKDFRFDYDQVAIRMTFRFAYSTNANIGRAICRIKTANAA